MEYSASDIEEWCEAEWEAWKADCSGFMKAVCAHAGLNLHGQANNLLDYLDSSSAWENLGTDSAAAIARASAGFLVVGGLKKPAHGHVVIVVKSSPSRYPMAYWGRLGSVGRRRTTINWSWNQSDLALVKYYGYKL